MPRILITDDDIHLRKLVRTYAEVEGFQCTEVESGREAIDKISGFPFDILILDVMMPGLNGFETLAEIRKISEIPVIMLTARGEEYDRLLGFHLGADDYVEKPFSPRELMARIRAMLKRTTQKQDASCQFGALCIDPQSRSVTLQDAALTLTMKEFDLLAALAQNEHIVLTREVLLEKVWGFDYAGDTRTVDTHIKSLRERLGSYRRLIRTVWGVGYKFEYEE